MGRSSKLTMRMQMQRQPARGRNNPAFPMSCLLCALGRRHCHVHESIFAGSPMNWVIKFKHIQSLCWMCFLACP
ncbi:hypothetical protein DUNSADRAFT_3666 [Dunaliella salina]|uniref:Encoded protein n=1 Tax=Dunaliella salina TaxID=3046 RepID=A0ABQ7GTL8_DUNSA|nr:hypothetical protein DUNSADRAFT_3666 [Dunaliella salina]|eukprot:KAF5837945.1 hypothetical protein DUNSADRAFT_3666 [Dunaliella salina]